MINTFFQGLQVVELASILAGPAVGLFFAELGADVIKIENKKTSGDITRQWRLPNESREKAHSAYYCSVNWGKQVLMLDLSDKKDHQQLLEVIQAADVVISNFKPASAKKLHIDYEHLQKTNPKLIFAQLTGFGEDDARPAFDVVLQAETGFLYMNGEAEREPVRMPVALIDLLAAHQLKEAILVALLHRERTGEGSYVSSSLLESALASLANQATNWLMGQHIPQRMGTKHPNIAPYGDIFYSKDNKPVVIAVGTDRQFKDLCAVLGCADVATQADYKINAARVTHRMALVEVLKPYFNTFNRDDLLPLLHKKGVPVGSIRDMREVFELEKAQAMILEEKMEEETTKRVRTVAFQIKLD